MNSQEFQCPICKIQYTETNPPRLLTMCGHTFCHKCIKSLITKKKDNSNKYKIKCHIDKIATQIQNPSPTYFPKNIILLQSLIKFKQKSNSTIFYQEEKNQFLSSSLLQTTNIPSRKSIVFGQKTTNLSFRKQVVKLNNMCAKHNKHLQVLCCVDLQKICTDCALFGKHKTHKFKNIEEVDKEQKIVTKKLTQIILKKKQIQTKIKNDQIQKQIVQLIQNKKTLLKDQIYLHFQSIYNFIKASEIQAYQNLNNVISKAQQSIQQKLCIEQNLDCSYENWKAQAENIIIGLQSQEKDQNLVNFISKNGYKQLIKSGQRLLSQIQKQQDMLIYQVQHQIQSMKFQTFQAMNQKQKLQDLLKLKLKVKETYQIKYRQRSTKQYENQKQIIQSNQKKCSYENHQHQEQSLLDDQYECNIQKPLKHSNSLNSIQLSSNLSSILSPNKKKSKYLEQEKINMTMTRKKNPSIVLMKPSSRQRTLTPCYSSSVLLQNNSILKNKPLSSKTNISQIPLKYLKGIQKVKNCVSDTLDLSGAQLGDSKIQQLFNNLKKFNHIKHIKLVKNKLTDAVLLAILTCFPQIQKLNLAQNKFTQKTLQKILEFQKEKKIQLNCLNLAQNKIIQRKQKLTLQQLKNQNVTVSL